MCVVLSFEKLLKILSLLTALTFVGANDEKAF